MSATLSALVTEYCETRNRSVEQTSLLLPEDYGLQAEAFTSPPKWHLAHTSWFFETFLLAEYVAGYSAVDSRYRILFNSYYQGVGERFPRPQRGLLSRPTIDEVFEYRARVDEAMIDLLESDPSRRGQDILDRCILGLNHEQQHQELFFTDIKYSFFVNPLYPAYCSSDDQKQAPVSDQQWLSFDGGLTEIGYRGRQFCFDNELPHHKIYLEPFQLSSRLVTNADYQCFIEDGGYQRPELWLADGWEIAQTNLWTRPLYWRDDDSGPREFTLYGLQPRHPDNPVCHLSAYEADAYAAWADARLPTEQEWEFAATTSGISSVSSATNLHPRPSVSPGLEQMFGECWQWTRSAYTPYPGYRAAAGAIGEYNGKFMSSQWVLRGGSCVTQPGHTRPSYRNFFYPQDRWQFTGLRLAR